MIRSEENRATLLYALATAVFAMALSWFVWRLMGAFRPAVCRDLPFYLIAAALLVLATRRKKLALGGVLLLAVWFLLTWPEDPAGTDLPVLWRWGREIYDSFEWGLTWNRYKGAMPISFSRVLALGSVLVSFLLVYLFPFAPVSLLVLTAPLYFIPDLTANPNWLYWLLAGLLAITTSLYRSRDRSHTRWPNPAVVLGIVGAVFLLQQLVTPDTLFHSGFSESLNRWNARRTGRIHGSFTLSRTGYLPDSGVLGGPVSPSENPMLDVTALPISYYLRGSVYYEFEGDRWQLPTLADSEILINEPSYDVSEEKAQALGLDMMHRFRHLYERGISYSMILEQRPRVSNLTTVFTPGPLMLLKSSEEVPSEEAPEALQSLAFWLEPEVTNVFRYTQEGLIYAERPIEQGVYLHANVMDAQGLRRGYELLHDFRPERIEPAHAYEELVRTYDPRLHELFYHELQTMLEAGDNAGFARTLVAIRDHFQQEYPYTLTPGPIPEDRTILPFFLETREGYCVYYASLTTELLRDIGVSARYAEGFVAPMSESDDAEIVTVTGSAGHAWAEIEYANAGWIMFETTPSVQMEYLDGIRPRPTDETTEAPEDTLDPDMQREQTEAPAEVPETEVPESQEPEEPEEPNPLIEGLIRYRRPVAAALFAAGWLLWRKRIFRIRHDVHWLRERFHSRPAELTERIWKDIRSLAFLENTELKTGTPRDTVLTLAQVYSVKDLALVSETVVLLERVLYGEETPDFDELKPLLRFHHTLENRIRAYMPASEWRLKRWLWSRRHPL